MGGWVTGGKAEADAMQRVNAAVVVALAPVCVEKFQHTLTSRQSGRAQKVDSWSQATSSKRLGNCAGIELACTSVGGGQRARYCSPPHG
jgi:hypothetical protein